MTFEKPPTAGVHGAVFPERPGDIYLLAADIIAMMRRSSDHYNKLVDDLRAQTDGTGSGMLQVAAFIGSAEVLRAISDQLELLSIEFATDADELIQEATHG